MKKILLFLVLPTLAIGLLSAITNGNQAPYGNTGSPGDGSNCTACHSGTAQTDTNISTNIPASGYIPGNTYTITISATKSNISKFGFQLTAEGSTNTKVGTFAITDATQTKLIQDEVTHTGLGTGATAGSKTWTVDWTAPAAGTGSVTFYSAVNAANADGGTGGDMILLSSLAVQEDLGNSISNQVKNPILQLFPSQSDDFIQLKSSNTIHQVRIFALDGKEVFEQYSIGEKQLVVDVQNFSKGIYLVHVQVESAYFIRKFIR